MDTARQVSVVMPVYNGERFLAEAIRSALEQDYPHKELLVIDDGSTDRSREILATFGSSIRVVTVPNGGPARARNMGMKLARGGYIAFLDADDVWLPGKLTAQVRLLESCPEFGTCFTGWHIWQRSDDDEYSRPEWALRPLKSPQVDATKSGWLYGRLLFDCALLTTTVMVRASLARRAGEFDETLRVGEDYDYWLRLSRLAQIARLDSVGALYRVVPSSASRQPHQRNYEYEVVRRAIERFGLRDLDEHQVEQAAIQRRLRSLLFQHGYLHIRQGDPAVALRAFQQCLMQQPLQPRVWVYVMAAMALRSVRRRPSSSA